MNDSNISVRRILAAVCECDMTVIVVTAINCIIIHRLGK